LSYFSIHKNNKREQREVAITGKFVFTMILEAIVPFWVKTQEDKILVAAAPRLEQLLSREKEDAIFSVIKNFSAGKII
jgi:hypothetical protein